VAADEVDNFTDKQRFLNTVYERFFQGYSVKVADTHGIVYTPQEIVDFMCAAVEEVLAEAFAYRLGNRSALEWVVDQYRVKTDKRSGIVSDPNTYSEDERYIVDLVEKVVQVSMATVQVVESLRARSLGVGV
jgi:predicted helicase